MSMVDTYKTDIAFKSDFVKTPSGGIDVIQGIANVKEALYRRLITSPGTLIHRPSYGVGIKNFQNSIASATKQQQLFNLIREQFLEDPRVDEVRGMSITNKDSEPDKIQLFVQVTLVGYGDQTLSFLPFEDN